LSSSDGKNTYAATGADPYRSPGSRTVWEQRAILLCDRCQLLVFPRAQSGLASLVRRRLRRAYCRNCSDRQEVVGRASPAPAVSSITHALSRLRYADIHVPPTLSGCSEVLDAPGKYGCVTLCLLLRNAETKNPRAKLCIIVLPLSAPVLTGGSCSPPPVWRCVCCFVARVVRRSCFWDWSLMRPRIESVSDAAPRGHLGET
jgi:hypothetical protein